MANERIKTLDDKIDQLQTRKRKLERKRAAQITKILNRCGVNILPDEILAGVVLEAVRAYKENDSRVAAWESEGLKILKPGRGRKKYV